ncbi:MAG: hypothetical protein C4516_02220 [Oxalobacter sp.]|nr:MAG: hypothetical protein C4516_02220 [Oxalobacter sp.]
MNQDVGGLRPGLVGSAEMVVGEANTALSMGSGRLPILATPALVALMEAAAQLAIDRCLPADYLTVGVHLDIRHEGATPVGMKVVASAELIAVAGRHLRFRVTARDEKEGISEGWHERTLSSKTTFHRLLRQKMRKPGAEIPSTDHGELV